MKGLELARKYYEDCFKDILFTDFKDIAGKTAVGLCGSGSECFGFDDELSTDHDFEPGFCIFIPGEDIVDRRTAFLLQRAYDKLPKEFMGFKRSLVSPVGGSRHGVIRLDDFVYEKLGGFPLTMEQWLRIPSYALAEAINGEVWYDGYGQLTGIREYVTDMPEDVRLKRLAGQLMVMAQSGQYNFERCLKHGERAAAGLAIAEFVKASLEVIFLLNHSYVPYYKWGFRALKTRLFLSEMYEPLQYLIAGDPFDDNGKMFDIGEVCRAVQGELRAQGITSMDCDDMEKHAYSVNDHIKDGNIRSLNIFCTV